MSSEQAGSEKLALGKSIAVRFLRLCRHLLNTFPKQQGMRCANIFTAENLPGGESRWMRARMDCGGIETLCSRT
jgi:hypothetical protein